MAQFLAVAEDRVVQHQVDAAAFRAALRELASGVALATSLCERRRFGCAVSSFVSLSLEPPSLLVCLSGQSSTLRAIRGSGAFAVNILPARHLSLARRFADPQIGGADRFSEGEWGELETGAPVLLDALAAVDCRLERIVEHATHAIVIGAAVAVASAPSEPALVHWRSRFETLA